MEDVLTRGDVLTRDDAMELDAILGDGAVRAVYQPIVELTTGRVVAHEALARGPVGSTLERLDRLFAVARQVGRLGELDWACRSAALTGALEAGMTRSVTLFVNVEPDAADALPTTGAYDVVREASRSLDVVVEVTQRSLVDAPGELLAMVSAVRALGWGVALDDVGAETASLALMPLLRPDVIKLDLALVQQRLSRDAATVVAAVNAHSERSGAVVLAEGIETVEHLATARAMGATLGQGWLFGRPDALPADVGGSGSGTGSVLRCEVVAPVETSVVAAAAGGRPLRRSTKALLLEMSWLLEQQAAQLGPRGRPERLPDQRAVHPGHQAALRRARRPRRFRRCVRRRHAGPARCRRAWRAAVG